MNRNSGRGTAHGPRALALRFLEAFCSADLEALEPLLAPELRFAGPLLQTSSRSAYLEHLAADRPDRVSYQVIDVVEGDDAVAVFWVYRKPQGEVRIGQLFRIRDGRISEMRLVFDPGSVTRSAQ